jgi:hypothetical protein
MVCDSAKMARKTLTNSGPVVLELCYSGVTVVLQWSYRGVTIVLP